MSQSQFTVSPQLKALRWRLLLSSLGVIGCTIATFGLVIYQVVAQSLEQKADRQLSLLAEAAAHSLPELAEHPEISSDRQPTTIDDDGDFDLPWQDLQQDEQSIEWFDADGHLLRRAGNALPEAPFVIPIHISQKQVAELEDTIDDNIHRLTIPVYAPGVQGALQGYVRVSESNEAIEEELKRLRSGLQWGGVLALVVSGAGGWWLTQQSLQPIDRSIRQLKQFTADASHELRNPLTAIKASVDVMQSHQERFHSTDWAKLDAIASATDQMSQLVDDLLWLARSDRFSAASDVPVLIPIVELLEEVMDQYLPQAEQKQIALKATELSDVAVLGNPFQLKRLFGNLIANALHYTPVGGAVTLSAALHDGQVIIHITDTGIGIAPEHLPLVFDRFWRADQARVRREGGAGLGLAIAQAIAQQHHGQITVTSQLGQGSCFQVELPFS